MVKHSQRPKLEAELSKIRRSWSEIRALIEPSIGGRERQADQLTWHRAKKVWGVFAKWAAKVVDTIGRDNLPAGPILPSSPGGRWHEATAAKYYCGADSTGDAGKLIILWGAVFHNPQKFDQALEARVLIEHWLSRCIFLEREEKQLVPLMDWVAEGLMLF